MACWPPERLLHGHRPLPRSAVLEGLCIDDYFVAARGPMRSPPPAATQCFDDAAAFYDAEGLLGSPEKDLVAAGVGTVVGAEFVASEGWARRGCVTVGAPRARRAALSAFSLEACRRRQVPEGGARLMLYGLLLISILHLPFFLIYWFE